MAEPREHLIELRPGDMFSNVPLFCDREKAVAVNSDDRTVCLYGSQRGIDTSPASSDIVRIDRPCQIPVGVGIKPGGKLPSLISLV